VETESQEPEVEPSKPAEDMLADALAGRYQFFIADVFDEALHKTTGFIWLYWGASGLIMLAMLAVGIVLGIVFFLVGIIMMMVGVSIPPIVSTIINGYLPSILMAPLFAGMIMISIRYVAGQTARAKMVFNYYKKPLPYWVVAIWIYFITGIAIFLGVLLSFLLSNVVDFIMSLFVGSGMWRDPQLYPHLAWIRTFGEYLGNFTPVGIVYCLYFFAIPLLADRGLPTWQTLEISRKVISRHWFKVFSTFIVIAVVSQLLPAIAILLAGLLVHKALWLLFIVYFWLLPFFAVCIGILYRDIFGVASAEQ
jgi:hypothetical protein